MLNKNNQNKWYEENINLAIQYLYVFDKCKMFAANKGKIQASC